MEHDIPTMQDEKSLYLPELPLEVLGIIFENVRF
jgi:hypothetical protein